MTTLNEGRNEIRIGNSDAKCLLENWVEERATTQYDTQEKSEETGTAQLYKDGHLGILSTNLNSGPEKETTFQYSYKPPQGNNVREKGSKKDIMERMMYAQVTQEVLSEADKPAEPVEYKSITQKDFNIDTFTPTKPAPTAHHDIRREQPVTFWTEHRDKVHSVSQVKTHDTPFRKNTAFSKPIGESWNQTQPYDIENVPKM